MIHMARTVLFYIVFLLPLIFMRSLSSAHQTDLTAGNFYPHHCGSTQTKSMSLKNIALTDGVISDRQCQR